MFDVHTELHTKALMPEKEKQAFINDILPAFLHGLASKSFQEFRFRTKLMVELRGQRQIVVYSARADAAVFRAAAAAGGFRQLILRSAPCVLNWIYNTDY